MSPCVRRAIAPAEVDSIARARELVQRPADSGDARLEERVVALGVWVDEIAARVRATELTNGDEKTAKELRRAVEAVAKHDPRLESRLTNRIDVLTDRLGTLASAVSTTSSELARRDGEIAALRRELENDRARIQTLGETLGREAPAAEIEELRKAVTSLSTQSSPRKTDEQVVRLGGKVDYLTERVDTLAKTVAATAAGLAGRDGELAMLRQKLEERTKHFDHALLELSQRPAEAGLGRRLDALEGQLQKSVADVVAQAEAAEELRRATTETLDAHATSQNSKLGSLVTRLDAVTADVESTLAGLAEKDAAAEHRFGEHDAALSGWSQESARIGALERQLAELAGRQESAGRVREDDLMRVAALESDRHAPANAEVDSVREAIAALLEDVERDRIAVAARLDALASDRKELATEIGDTSKAAADQLGALAERVDKMELLEMVDASETARMSADVAAKLEAIASFEGRLQAIADSVAQAGEHTAGEGRRLAELDERLQAVEQAGAAAATEIVRVSASWASELDRVAARIDETAVAAQGSTSRDAQAERLLTELNTRLDAIVHERQTVAAQIAKASENEVAELRTLIDGLRTRYSATELEDSGSPYVGGRLDDLALRLDSIENVDPVFGPEPATGEGRVRLELRALELRAERAEKAARQNRDAVLTQLELLAGQIESRFQKLESDAADSPDPDEGEQAEVVPLRGAEV